MLSLQRQGGSKLVANVIWDLLDGTGLTMKELQRHKGGDVPFSNATWEDVVL